MVSKSEVCFPGFSGDIVSRDVQRTHHVRGDPARTVPSFVETNDMHS